MITAPLRQVGLGRAHLLAGWSLLLLAALAAFANFGVIEALVVPNDALVTAANIGEAKFLFRLGTAAFLVVAVLDIITAAALHSVFEKVNRKLSAVTAWLRIAYAAVFLVAISSLTQVVEAGTGGLRSIETFTSIWHTGLILFGVHLVLLGYLAVNADFIHPVFGVMLILAGLGYLIDGFGEVLIGGYSLGLARFTFIGEVALMIWLLIKGGRLRTANTVGETR